MATGTGNLPYPGKVYVPFDILTAQELNEDVANIESLATGTGIGDGSVSTAALAAGSVTNAKVSLTPGSSTVVAAVETTGSTSYTDLATVTDAVTVTVGPSGCAIVSMISQMSNNTGNAQTFLSYTVSGASTVAASDTNSVNYQSYTGGGTDRRSFTLLLTGLTAGSNTFKMKYRVSGGIGTFAARRISVLPL